MKRFVCILFVLLLLMISACSMDKDLSLNESTPQLSDISTLPEVETQSKAEKLLDNMTLEDKIGQLFIIRPDAMHPNLTLEQINDPTKHGVTEFDVKMQETLKRYPVGGVVLFGKNISSPTQLTTFIDDMQQQNVIPLFVGIDEEGGKVSRISELPNFDVPKFESMQKIGESGNIINAKNVGLSIGSYLELFAL